MAAPKKGPAAPASSLKTLRERMTKRYGEGRVTARSNVTAYEVIPTGTLTLDLALGVGGWVRGRTQEIVGVEGAGKTTTCITSMVEAQRYYPDLAVAIIDMEQSFDFDWAEKLGLDTSDDRFLHVYPDDSEDVSDQIKEMTRTGLFSMVVVDSIGGMESRQAFVKDAEEFSVGRNAQVISRMVKQVATLARQNNVAIIFVNQYRANIGSMSGMDISAGPKALRYNTTIKAEMSRGPEQALKAKLPWADDPVPVGQQAKVRITRNKVAPAGGIGLFWIINQDTDEYGPIGIDKTDEALIIGSRFNLFGRRGSWYDLPDGSSHNGAEAVKAHLRGFPDEVAKIREAALAKVADQIVDAEPDDAEVAS